MKKKIYKEYVCTDYISKDEKEKEETDFTATKTILRFVFKEQETRSIKEYDFLSQNGDVGINTYVYEDYEKGYRYRYRGMRCFVLLRPKPINEDDRLFWGDYTCCRLNCEKFIWNWKNR